MRHDGNTDVWVVVWSAWCWFHLGEYKRALDLYLEVEARNNLEDSVADNIALDLAVCYFYLGTFLIAIKQVDIMIRNILLVFIIL